jgi:predicted transcriptional regulator
MSNGRKPAHLTILEGRDNRQRIWETLRNQPQGISIYTIGRTTNIPFETVKTYVDALCKGGYLERGEGVGVQKTYRLMLDKGVEAPRLKIDGSPSKVGQGTEAMWRTLRMLKDINASELAAHASHATNTSISTAKNFLKWLNWAGYLDITVPAQPGRQARYRLTFGMYTGPLPPVIQRSGQLFDPNLGSVVYVLPSKR